MKLFKTALSALLGAWILALSFSSVADVAVSTVGVAGYDLVSYHTGKKPLPGNGNYVVTHEGVNYLFVSQDNADKFAKNKEKYLPAYGGFCAFGVAVGKKFIADPTVWEIVDGKLYLNLDNGIKADWAKDIPGYIAKADKNWMKIENVPAGEL